MELTANVLIELLIGLSLLGIGVIGRNTQCTRHLCHQLGIVGIIGHADVTRLCTHEGKPVAISQACSLILVSVACLGGKPIHVLLHGSEILAQHFLVAIHQIDIPWNHDSCI